MTPVEQAEFSILGRPRTPGRALLVQPDGTLFRSHHLDVFSSDDDGQHWQRRWAIPRSARRRLAEPFRLLCRLLRHEVRGLAVLSDGSAAAVTRTGLYRAGPGETRMQRAAVEAGSVPLMLPTTLNTYGQGRVIWGEYGGNAERRPIRLFVSDDAGRSYHAVYAFKPGEIRHVHNVLYDPGLDKLWVLAGDHGEEPGIGLLSADFRSFEWVVKGEQKFRAVCLFDLGDRIVYATDTEMEPNGIYRLDKATGKIERLAETDGSCIYACRCGGWHVISTTAEETQYAGAADAASIWVSRDAERWTRVYTQRKDSWSYKYFQFGSLVLPRGDGPRNLLMFSGQAVKSIDGRVLLARVGPG